MASSERVLTDKRLDRLEKKLEKLYSDAEKDISDGWNKYMQKSAKVVEKKQLAYESALASGDKNEIKTTKEALRIAQRKELTQNKEYKKMLEETTKKLALVNQEAIQMVNNELPWVYMTNYNAIKKTADAAGVSFKLVNTRTMKDLLENGVQMKKVDIPKDMLWNKKKINNAIMQGISRGESIPKISNRLFPIIDEKSKNKYKELDKWVKQGKVSKEWAEKEKKRIVEQNKNAAIRNARTMITTAENKGKFDSYHALEEKGLVIKKVWISTKDSRTRDWHLSMDGQEVDIDENFIDGNGNELEYPGDPSAEPETYYNCRCTMKTKVLGFKKDNGEIEKIDYSVDFK